MNSIVHLRWPWHCFDWPLVAVFVLIISAGIFISWAGHCDIDPESSCYIQRLLFCVCNEELLEYLYLKTYRHIKRHVGYICMFSFGKIFLDFFLDISDWCLSEEINEYTYRLQRSGVFLIFWNFRIAHEGFEGNKSRRMQEWWYCINVFSFIDQEFSIFSL